MIEVEVHQQLRQLQRQQRGRSFWPHQLTMARLVARGLRLQRSALIQVPADGQHRLSYVLPGLMWSGATLLCAPSSVREQILRDEIPFLQQTLHLDKPVLQITPQQWPGDDFQGLALMDPLDWLRDRLTSIADPEQRGRLPTSIPLILDGAEALEEWIQQVLTLRITQPDWRTLQLAVPAWALRIEQTQLRLTSRLWQRTLNRCVLLSDETQELFQLLAELPQNLPSLWNQLRRQIQQPDHWLWADINREMGSWTLLSSPLDFRTLLAEHLWGSQPLVLIGRRLDLDREACSYRHRLGLPDMTTLNFPLEATRHIEELPLYLPLTLPAPNSPRFHRALVTELRSLLVRHPGSAVILLSDHPLQEQVGSELAGDFGSRVRVNLPHQVGKGILVCDWHYWLDHAHTLPAPNLLVMATLPFPSVEDPWVAGQVAFMKQHRRDWFRSYLLPVAAGRIQRALEPLQHSHGTLAILDNRVITRSYGSQLLEVLPPNSRLNRHPEWPDPDFSNGSGSNPTL